MYSNSNYAKGVLFKDGVVLGADTRATEGPIVADKVIQSLKTIANVLLIPFLFRIVKKFIILPIIFIVVVQARRPTLKTQPVSFSNVFIR